MSRRRPVDPIVQVPPNNSEAEAAALGAILLTPSLMDTLDLTLADFHALEHVAIYQVMLGLKGRGEELDLVTLGGEIRRMGKTGDVNPEYLFKLLERKEPPYNAPSHVRILKAFTQRRIARERGLALVEAADDPTSDIAHVTDQTAKALADVAGAGSKPGGHVFKFSLLGDVVGQPVPVKWLIKDYLDVGSLSVIFGGPGSGKTFIALDWGLSIATGTPWQGHKTPNPGAVFYICGEDRYGIPSRIKAWLIEHRLDNTDIPFFVSEAGALFLDPVSVEGVSDAVAAVVGQYGKPALIVIDTLARCFGGDENSTQDMSAFVAAVEKLKDRFGCAVLIVHHTSKGDASKARGNGALCGGVGWEYGVTASEDVRTLRPGRDPKAHKAPPPVAFTLGTVELPWTDLDTLEPVTSCVLRQATMPAMVSTAPKMSAAKRIALEALKDAVEAAGGPAHVDAWRDRTYESGISKGKANAKKNAFWAARKELIEGGLVRSEGDNLFSISPPTSETSENVISDACDGRGSRQAGQGVSLDTPDFLTPPCVPDVTEEEKSENPTKGEIDSLLLKVSSSEARPNAVASLAVGKLGGGSCITCPSWRDGAAWQSGTCVLTGERRTRKSVCTLSGREVAQ